MNDSSGHLLTRLDTTDCLQARRLYYRLDVCSVYTNLDISAVFRSRRQTRDKLVT